MTLTRKDIQAIFYDIVRFSKPLQIGGINGYCYVSNGNTDFNHPTGGKDFDGYINREFWSRDWELAGADKNTMKLETGVLFIESKETQRPILENSKLCHDFYIVFADTKECKNCETPIVRTDSQIDNSTVLMLNSIVNELLNYDLYNINGVDMWTTEEYIEYHKALSPTDIIIQRHSYLSNYIKSSQLDFQAWKSENLIGYSTKLTFCGCLDSILEKDFFSPTVAESGQVECKSC